MKHHKRRSEQHSRAAGKTFGYDEGLFRSCVETLEHNSEAGTQSAGRQQLGSDIRTRIGGSTEHGLLSVQAPCRDLFNQHAAHFGRPLLDDDGGVVNAQVQQRVARFLSTVCLIAHHQNSKRVASDRRLTHDEAGQRRIHHFDLTLNQFADVEPVLNVDWHELEEFDHYWSADNDGNLIGQTRRALRRSDGVANAITGDVLPVSQLFDEHSVLQTSAKFKLGTDSHGHHHRHHLHKKVKKLHGKDKSATLNLKHRHKTVASTAAVADAGVNDNNLPPVHSYAVDLPDEAVGTQVFVRAEKTPKKHRHKRHTQPSNDDRQVSAKDDHQDNESEDDGAYTNKFDRHLNWATNDNPDGIPLVHESIEQGRCGSCWAFAATGTIEASAARGTAQDAYETFIASSKSSREKLLHSVQNSVPDNDRASLQRLIATETNATVLELQALEYAQYIERQSFDQLELSIQELIDCDKGADRGCVGGNPVQSFFFVHEYGLAPSLEYPYIAREDICRVDVVNHPLATVDSWGLLGRHHEDLIKLVLQLIGPVAVSINAADPAFVAYQGGIFNKEDCAATPNHAVLIVGYGEEMITVNSTTNVSAAILQGDNSSASGQDDDSLFTIVVPYWIIRNSWGKSWGEDGFMRIKRGVGKKGVMGLCGITHNPSVALGGAMIPDRQPINPYSFHSYEDAAATTASEHAINDHAKVPPSFCDRFKSEVVHSSCSSLLRFADDHRASFLGIVGVFFGLLLAAFPLSYQCRKQRRYKRRPLNSHAANVLQARERALSSSSFLSPDGSGSTPNYGTI